MENKKFFIKILFIIICIVVFDFVLANRLHTKPRVIPNAPSGTYLPCQKKIADSNLISTLASQYNITLTGPGARIVSRQRLMYDTVCMLANYKFYTLLHGTTITVIDDGKEMCSGVALPEKYATHYDVHISFCANSDAGSAFTLTHELAHIIQYRNSDIYNAFCANVYNTDGNKKTCNTSAHNTRVLPTTNCRCEYLPQVCDADPSLYYFNQPHECFSDMVGSFFTYKQGWIEAIREKPVGSDLMSNYSTNFPEYYNFARDTIFVPVVPQSNQ